MVRDGRIKQIPFFVRVYNYNEIEQMLLKAGLEIVKVFGGWDGAPLACDTFKMILIARKTGTNPRREGS